MRSGDLFLEVSSSNQATALMKLQKLAHLDLTVAPHSTLNFSRGVISPADFLNVSTEKIKENMKAQKVCDVGRITIRRDGQVLNTKHLILTFSTPDLPQTVKMAYIRCSVRPYIPNPLRCFQCQRYGRSKNVCRGQPTCPRCGESGPLRGLTFFRDLLIETISDLQTKSFLLAKTFFNSPVTVSPHKTLNSCRGVISEPDLLSTPDAEILEGFSDQGVIQVRRITIKRDSNIIPTKHIILTFNKPKLPTTVKAGYLNCKIRPYIPNPLCCFKCQRFGHSLTSCRGQLTCSRCASVGHSSTDCTLEQKCVNCTQSHPSDSKLCQKWKIEKQIQEIKTNRNISYFEARRLIVPQLTQTYAQAARPSTISTASQTDPNLSNIICPPLQCLTPISSKNPLPGTSSSVSTFSTSSSSTQDNLLPSPSGILPTIQGESLLQIPILTTTTTTSPGNNLNNLVSPLGTESHSHTTPATLNSVSTENFPESVPNESNSEHSTAAEAQQIISKLHSVKPVIGAWPVMPMRRTDVKLTRLRIAKFGSCANNPKTHSLTPHRSRNATPTEITTDDEDMITYDVEEEELEQDPFILPEGYLRALTPSRYRNYRE
ncbi:uncharacterized protein TNCV_3200561 [Trichonephila clavipes]|nr:uncharacterized protein TNCV_3200561 [Trichonephila clavipes]